MTTPIKTTSGDIGTVCAPCGISANVLTCLHKYGRRPNRVAFDVSTSHMGKCDFCGEERLVTQTRDFFYPDFGLLKKVQDSFDNGRRIV